jgi:hypothetical protein
MRRFERQNHSLGVDMGELRIPVGVAVTLLGLAVSLQAVTRRIEQFTHQGAAHLVALLLQRLGQSSHAFALIEQRREVMERWATFAYDTVNFST